MGRPCRKRYQNRVPVDEEPPEPEVEVDDNEVNNRWDPVTWYGRHGYNVSEMIKAPGR